MLIQLTVICRQRSEELEKAWWNEQAELSSGPAAAGKGAVPEEEAASTQWQVSQTHHSFFRACPVHDTLTATMHKCTSKTMHAHQFACLIRERLISMHQEHAGIRADLLAVQS